MTLPLLSVSCCTGAHYNGGGEAILVSIGPCQSVQVRRRGDRSILLIAPWFSKPKALPIPSLSHSQLGILCLSVATSQCWRLVLNGLLRKRCGEGASTSIVVPSTTPIYPPVTCGRKEIIGSSFARRLHRGCTVELEMALNEGIFRIFRCHNSVQKWMIEWRRIHPGIRSPA